MLVHRVSGLLHDGVADLEIKAQQHKNPEPNSGFALARQERPYITRIKHEQRIKDQVDVRKGQFHREPKAEIDKQEAGEGEVAGFGPQRIRMFSLKAGDEQYKSLGQAADPENGSRNQYPGPVGEKFDPHGQVIPKVTGNLKTH